MFIESHAESSPLEPGNLSQADFPQRSLYSERASAIIARSGILGNPTFDTSWLFDRRHVQLIEYLVETHGDDCRKYGPLKDPVPAAVHDLRVAQIARNMPSFKNWLRVNDLDPNTDILEALTHDVPETLRARAKKSGIFYNPEKVYGDVEDICGNRETFRSVRNCMRYATDDEWVPDHLRIPVQEDKSRFAPTDQRAIRAADKCEQVGWDAWQRILGNLPDGKVHSCWVKAELKSFVIAFTEIPEIKGFYDPNRALLAYEDRVLELRRAFNTTQGEVNEVKMTALRGMLRARGGLSMSSPAPES